MVPFNFEKLMRIFGQVSLSVFSGISLFLYGSLFGQSEPDDLREFQYRAVKLNESNWIHWGDQPGKFSNHTSHSNRLIPVYTWGVMLDSIQGENSVYRDSKKLNDIYGFDPTETVNPDAEYFDQTQIYDIQKRALKAGKKNIILMVFDGMDWQTTQAASIYKNKSVLYTEGRGTGLGFQDYVPLNADCDFGFCVTAPHNNTTETDVDAQIVKVTGDQRLGGYSGVFGGGTPWSNAADANYLIGKNKEVPHPYTDSATSATSLNTGWKTYSGAINVDAEGRQLKTLAHEMQAEGRSIGVVTSVQISHATPACVYAHNVNRGDYQDIARDLLGLRSVAHKGNALPGVDVLIGAGWGGTMEDDREKQGSNYVPGNRFLTAADQKRVDVANGGKYVVVQRESGQSGCDALASAAKKAVKNKHRLFGFFGENKNGHLPFQTANGDFKPTVGVNKGSNYQPEEVPENPTLSDMTKAAFQVLEKNDKGFFLMVEAGDVDWALHNNNIDDAIGAVFSGEEAFESIVDWVETNSNWKETCLILTADHGHMMVLDDPKVLTGERRLGDKAVFETRLTAKKKKDAKEKAKKAAEALAKANQATIDAGGFFDLFESEKHDLRQALRGDWKYKNKVASCVSDPELYKKYKNHGPIIRWPFEFKDGTIEFEIKPTNVKRLVFTLNEEGHVIRSVIGEAKNTKVFGWAGLSKETKPEILATGFIPQIKSLNNKWTKCKLVVRGEKATITIGSYSEKLNHASIGREKGEVTLSFAGGKLSVKNFRLKPSGSENAGIKLAAAQESQVELKSIFDGKTLNGWHNPYDWGETKIVDNEIQLVASKKFFLMTNLQYNDYEFEADIRLPKGLSNSGFMLRGQEKRNKVFGYQAEADPTDRKWSGGLYDEGRRQWLNPLADQPKAQEAFKKTDWNTYRIVCEGDHLQVWVNGIQTTDYYDPVDLMGGIGVQHHGEDGQVYRFRNLKVGSTGRHVWKPIFDGSSLDGWKTSGGGNWELKDGVLVGTRKKSEQGNSLLFSEESYSDFTAKVSFRLTEGNSGFCFRSQLDNSKAGIKGMQAKLENSELIGGLYETGGRKWLAKPLHYYPEFSKDRQKGRTKQWKSAHKAKEWSTMVVSAHGDRIVTHVGDILACDLVDPDGSKEGKFALQLPGGQDMKIEVKSIELLVKEEK